MAKYNSTKFYWLQLKEDFFEDDSIEWLESQDNGSAYALFYLKLCLKSLKTNGVLIRRVGEMILPYDAAKLSKLTGTPTDTVKAAMVYLQRCGLIKFLENGELYMTQVETMIGAQSVSAFKKQQQRALQTNNPALEDGQKYKGLPEGGQGVDKGVDICPPDIDIEIELEKEKEKDSLASDDAPFTLTGEGGKAKKEDSIPFSEIVMLYNTLAEGKLPQVTKLSEARRKAISARWKEGNDLETFKKVFQNAVESDFLLGKTGGTFKAGFDWLLAPTNFLKTLEGNYNNRRGAQHHDNERTTGSNADAERIERENEKTRKWLEERAARARQLKAERERLEAAGGIHEPH